MSTVVTQRATDYKVADIALADWGRKEISIAEHEMPGLMAIRKKYAKEKPLEGVRITGSLHMTIQTAVLIETLVELGASVRWASCNIFSTQDHAAAAIAQAGVPVFAWKGETLEEYWGAPIRPSSTATARVPQLVVDDGGDVTLLIHKGYELENGSDWVNTPSGSHEEKVIKDLLKKVHAENPKLWHGVVKRLARCFRRDHHRRASPLQDAAGRQAAGSRHQRQRFGDEIEVRQSVRLPRVAGRRHQARDRRHAGRQSRGYLRLRRCRQGLGAIAARHGRSRDRDGNRSDQCAAGRDGRLPGHDGRRDAWASATSTSPAPATSTSSRSSTCQNMKDQAIVCNIGHFDNEIQVDRLNDAPGVKKLNIKPQVDKYTFPDGHEIFLLAEGRLVNLGCATGHPSFVMSNSFSNQTLAQLDLWKNKDVYKIDVYTLPKKLDEEVARLHLEKIGVKLTTLSPRQADYIGVPVDGPYKPDHYRY